MMKNSILFLIAVTIIGISCDEGQKEQQVAKDDEKKAVKKVANDRSCFTSEKIYPSTAWVWSQSWATYVNKKDTISFITLDSPELHFSDEKLKALQKKTKGANGVLLYYILKQSATSPSQATKPPSLAMINTVNCKQVKECQNECVLVKWYGGVEEFISIDTLKQYRDHWESIDSTRAKDIKGYVPVNGYNYSWKTLKKLSNPKGGITVKYGVRTLGPGEIGDFTPKSKITEIIVGNTVVCNILIGWDGSSTSFREVINGLEDDEELDFARPCPMYCD